MTSSNFWSDFKVLKTPTLVAVIFDGSDSGCGDVHHIATVLHLMKCLTRDSDIQKSAR